MSQRHPSFALLLPIAIPVLCFTVLSAIFTANYLELNGRVKKGQALWIHNKQVNVTIPRDAFLHMSIMRTAWIASRPIQSINFPAMATELAVSGIMRTFPDSYRPKSFGSLPDDLFVWRGIIFPAYCIPFWWFAGYGVDAALKRRQLRWPILLLGTVLCAFFIFIAIGLSFTVPYDKSESNAFVWWGFAVWIPLQATFPFAWLRKKRSPKQPDPALPEAPATQA